MINSHRYIPLILFALSCILYACHREVNSQLDSAESLLGHKPDSALSLLSDINSDQLKTNRLNARFALLKSIALDKCYYDEDNDSLINIAVDFYSAYGNQENKMKALYYQGIVRFNAGNLTAATVSFEKAEKEALSISEHHFLGLIYRGLTNVFNLSNNLTETVRYARKALEEFEYNNDTIFVDYAKSALGIALMNNCQFKEARGLFNELIKRDVNPALKTNVLSYLADTYVMCGDSLNKAINIYQLLPRESLFPISYSYYALALAQTGKQQLADNILKQGYLVTSSSEEKVMMDYTSAVVDSIRGNYRDAYLKTRIAAKMQDSLTRSLLHQSTIAAQRDYYRNETLIRDGIVKRQKTLLIFGGIIAFLILSLVVSFLVIRAQRKEARLKEQMAHLSLLNESTQQDNSHLIGALFFEKIARLCSLSGAYYSAADDEYKQEYLTQFKKGLKDMQDSPSLFRSLENDLNQYCSNIMMELRTQVPSMKEQHCRYASLFFAGVPNELIHLIMSSNSVASVRTMKSRIRTEIKNSEPKDEGRFLEMLEPRKQPPKKTQE